MSELLHCCCFFRRSQEDFHAKKKKKEKNESVCPLTARGSFCKPKVHKEKLHRLLKPDELFKFVVGDYKDVMSPHFGGEGVLLHLAVLGDDARADGAGCVAARCVVCSAQPARHQRGGRQGLRRRSRSRQWRPPRS